MGLEEIEKEIIEQATKEAERIINEAKKEAEKIFAEAKENLESYKKRLKQDEENQINSIKKMALAHAQLELNKQLLEKKKSIIDEVFEKVTTNIKNLPDKKRKEYLQKLIEKAKTLEPAKIYCNKKDSAFFNGLKTTNTEIIGGFIAENSDETIRIDYSFDTIVENIKEKSTQDIAKILFKE